MQIRNRILAFAAAAGVSASYLCLGAPASSQVERGQAAFASNCASCHGAALGGGFGPPLKGAQFLGEWDGKTARNLYSRILTTMPASDPGSLPSKTVLALTVYLLSENGVSVGSKAPASPDQLNAIVIKH